MERVDRLWRPRWIRRASWAVVMAMVIAVAGCQESYPTHIERAHWDPAYQDLFWTVGADPSLAYDYRGEVEEEIAPLPDSGCCHVERDRSMESKQPWLRSLLARVNLESYWQLVDRVLHHAPDVDRLIVIENAPGHSLGSYMFILLVEAQGHVYMYASLPSWFYLSPEGRTVTFAVYPVWGRVESPQQFEDYWRFLEEIDVWESVPRLLDGYGGGGNYWCIHLYERNGDKAVTYISSWIQLDHDVAYGTRSVRSIPRILSHTSYEFDLSDERERGSESDWRARERTYDQKSYVLRVILSGAFQLINQEYEKTGRLVSESK